MVGVGIASLVIPKMLLEEKKIDPLLAHYTGRTLMDAGYFYCPYIPLMTSSTLADEYVEPIRFKTRYGQLAL